VTTVLICDDRRSVREGLTRVMSAVPGVHRIDCVAHGDELLARFSRQPVDVVLVGTQRAVPTGVEATRRLVAAHPQANVIVFGAPDDAGSIAAAIAGGARGYLRWDASRPELVAALAHTLASTAVPTPRAPTDPGVQLTERELQVLRGMSQGKSNGQIGRELYLSEDTVKTPRAAALPQAGRARPGPGRRPRLSAEASSPDRLRNGTLAGREGAVRLFRSAFRVAAEACSQRCAIRAS
jgi:DNA-binding NarL/FixJ family response regulator